MKIAYVMSRFPKITETFVLCEMEAMDKAGLSVEVFPLLKEHQAVKHPEAERWMKRAHYTPFISRPILKANWNCFRRAPRAYLRLVVELLFGTWRSLNFFVGTIGIFPKSVYFALEMKRLHVDHIHAHFANHPAMASLIINRLTGIPFSFTAHGTDLHVTRRMLDKKVQAAKFVVAISQYNKNMIVDDCGEATQSKVHVVHCGIDPGLFQPENRFSASPLQLICVASLDPVKGHRYLIEACRILKERGLDFVCHLVGDGPLRSRVKKQIASCDLGERMILHGALPRCTVAKMLRNSDVAILPSVHTRRGAREGIPVALMEAMATGLPVISSSISGIPELVSHSSDGILVPPRDVHAIANAIEKLNRDPHLRKVMGETGREKVLRDFNLWGNAAELLRLIRPNEASTVPQNVEVAA